MLVVVRPPVCQYRVSGRCEQPVPAGSPYLDRRRQADGNEELRLLGPSRRQRLEEAERKNGTLACDGEHGPACPSTFASPRSQQRRAVVLGRRVECDHRTNIVACRRKRKLHGRQCCWPVDSGRGVPVWRRRVRDIRGRAGRGVRVPRNGVVTDLGKTMRSSLASVDERTEARNQEEIMTANTIWSRTPFSADIADRRQ